MTEDKGNKSFLSEAEKAHEADCMAAERLSDRRKELTIDFWKDAVDVRDALSCGVQFHIEDKEQLRQLLFAIKTLREFAKTGDVDYSNLSMLSVNLVTMLLDSLEVAIAEDVDAMLEKEGLL